MTDSKLTASEALAAADIAREAARLVARPGGWWSKGATQPGAFGPGAVCAATAINKATTGDCTGCSVGIGAIVCDTASRRVGGSINELIEWNNDPSRQQSDVVELFESIAKHFDREASKVER
jgi:hypothetical protein